MTFRILPGFSQRRTCYIPRLERLDDRALPAVSSSLVNGVLTLKGDNRANTILIQDDPTGLTIIRDGINQVIPPGPTSPSTIVIKTGAGRDAVGYTSTGTPQSGTRIVRILLGKGNDTVTANINAGLSGSAALQINVQGGHGKDTFRSVVQGDLAGSSSLQLGFTGGAGTDNYFVESTAQVLDHASLILNAIGGNGRNMLAANLEGPIAAGAAVSINLSGGPARDTIFTSYRGLLDGTLAVHQDGGAGNDVVSSLITARNGSNGQVQVAESGGTGDDRMTLQVHHPGAANALQVSATMDGGPGQDFGRATSDVLVQNIELPLFGGQIVPS
jgi:hypothetical protein